MAQLKVNPRDHEQLMLSLLCDRGARLQPDNLIVTKTKEGHHTCTYREHQIRTLRLASALSQWGVQLEDRVGTLLWNSAWNYECYHAVTCMGAVLHTLNLRLAPADLTYIIDHAKDRVIVVDFDLWKILGLVDEPVLSAVELFVCVGEDGKPNAWTVPPVVPSSKVQDYEAFLSTGKDGYQWPDFPETTSMGLCYTSGTTGQPKGVAYSHRSTFVHTLAANNVDQLAISGSSVILPFVPMFHVLSWGVPFICLMNGARIIFNSRYMDAESLLNLMIDWKVEMSTGVPTVWLGVMAAVKARGVETIKSSLSLKRLTCGGSAPPAGMMHWYEDNLGVQFVQGWGMTEMNPLGTLGIEVATHADIEKTAEERFKNVVKQGLPLPGVAVRIANPDDLSKDMPQGETGELLVKGPWIIQEYFQNDSPDKFHNGWLITGDIAKIDEEGAIVITDRSKDVIKSGGEWISSIDLENLIAAMPEVAMACVVGVPHPKWDERPVAIVVLNPDGKKDGLKERVHQHCSTKFAHFQLPDDILVWDSIPLTSTGKLDKKVVRGKLSEEGYQLPSLASPLARL